MIRITLMTGPMTGESRSSDQFPASVSPETLLGDLAQRGWEWSIDYSQATSEETLLWGKHDLAVRAVRALTEGRTARFLGRVYGPAATSDELMALVGSIEDAIVESGRNVFVLRDDANGLIIGVHGYEES